MRGTPLRAAFIAVAVAVPAACLGAGPAGALAAAHGKARLSVSRLGRPPAQAVTVGDRVRIPLTVRNRGRHGGRSPVKLIVPAASGARHGKRLALKPDKRFGAGTARKLGFHFPLPRKLSPGPEQERAAWDLAACVRRHGDGSPFRCRTAKRKLIVAAPPLPPRFKPGGRSAGDRLFPQIGNTGYDATHYDIDVDYDPVDNRFSPDTRSTMTATATQDLGRFSLDFQRLNIKRVEVDGTPARFELVNAKPRLAGATQPVKLIVDPAAGIPRERASRSASATRASRSRSPTPTVRRRAGSAPVSGSAPR